MTFRFARMDPLDAVFLGNSTRTWLLAGAIFAVIALGLFAIRRLVTQRLAELAKRTETDADDVAVDLLRRTRAYFIIVVSLVAALQALDVPDRVREVARYISVIALVLQASVWGNGLIAYWLHEWAVKRGQDRSSATTIAAFGALARFALWLVLGLVALQNLGINVTTLVTGLGITGVAVALAVQNILGDLFAALSIVVDKPFVVGDSIAVDTMNGTVEKVGLKTTRVRAISGELVIFSNTDLLKSRVRNMTLLQQRRVVITLSVALDTPPDVLERIPSLLRDIIEHVPTARFDRSHFFQIGDSGLEFETVYWVDTPDYGVAMDTRQAVNLGIIRRLSAEGIAFAFPTRRVVVHGAAVDATTAAAAGAGDPSPPSPSEKA
ncbi:MAG: mechanosensitive ion channel family protein [Gemmatimonadaceae bacterium]